MDAQAQTTLKFLHLPYVKGASERIEHKCKHLHQNDLQVKGNSQEVPSVNEGAPAIDNWCDHHTAVSTVWKSCGGWEACMSPL